MASIRTYIWQQGDNVWQVAKKYLPESGYSDTATFVRFIWASNSGIQRWWAVPVGTRIVMPYLSS